MKSNLTYSDIFLRTIQQVDSEISEKLIDLNGKSLDDNNICFIDIKDNDNLSYKIETKTGFRNQEIKTGRMITKLIKLSKNKFSDKEKEDFTNRFKANLLVETANFKICDGDDIYEFYSAVSYDKFDGVGQLGKSCMNKKPKYFFDLYTKNPNQIKLLILERDNKLVGRCLLWTTDNGFKLMDRIYTYLDSDIELFKIYGDRNGYFYKDVQNTSYRNREDFNYKFKVKNKKEVRSEDILVSLDTYDFDHYPYLDSLCYFNSDNGKMSNHLYKINDDFDRVLLLCSTDGEYKLVN